MTPLSKQDHVLAALLSLASSIAVIGCGSAGAGARPVGEAVRSEQARVDSAPATPAEADRFVSDVNTALRPLYIDSNRRSWIKATFVTQDTEQLAAEGYERVTEYLTRTIRQARRFDGLELAPETDRSLYLLRFAAGLPAPAEQSARKELSQVATKLESLYSTGKYCSTRLKGHGRSGEQPRKAAADDGCRNLIELSRILAEERDYDLLLEAWRGWHSISPPMRPLYARMVELGNEGARELGFADMAEIWTGSYDMSAAEFGKDMDRLWSQVKPLYDELHCYTRARLQRRYGKNRIPDQAPIPAHLLGNMWAQQWDELYPMLEPFPGQGSEDLTRRLQQLHYDPVKMVRLAEKFFTSLGMDALPETFWQRSLFERPQDREVECHASAWSIDLDRDLRIKMCIEVKYDDLVTIHHELGHNYYTYYYRDLPPLFMSGANDGFHEGIGDTLALSVTPSYLKQVGLLQNDRASQAADLNQLMYRALSGVAFLPFGKLIDTWRLGVFRGTVPPEEYNEAWWQLREGYQGVAAPLPRSEADFDPGAKYHVPANTPYTRYFIAHLLQYQFHRALCKLAGHTGPLHRCSIYGNAAAGERLIAMLRLGASRPWQEALATLTGERAIDATALLDYYAPLHQWLEQQNRGEACGW
jgi:peptidyl-dipeptidase A